MLPRSLASILALPMLASLVLPASGCYAEVDTFATRGAKHWCHRLEECYRATFDDVYDGDMDRCREAVEDSLLDFHEGQEDLRCEYDPDDAKRCIQTARSIRNDCSDQADQLMIDDCYGNVLAAAVFAPAEVYDCGAGLQPEPEAEPGALVSSPDDAPASSPAP